MKRARHQLAPAPCRFRRLSTVLSLARWRELDRRIKAFDMDFARWSAGEMLNIHDLKAAYEKAIGQ
jgi:hypothetical protein